MSGQRIVRFDWAMKHLLRNKANFDIVEGFLCALLNDNDIKVIEILESESNQDSDNDKFNRVDVLVKDKLNRNIIIEIQNTRESDYLYRVLYGASKNIAQSIEIGDEYKNINKVISVNILYFDLGIGDDYLYYGKTEFLGLNTNERIDKNNKKVEKLIPKGAKYNQIEIFPEYYLIQVEKYKNVIGRAIDEWIFWFKNEKIKEGSKSKNIKKVEKKLSILKMSPEERAKYEYFLGRLASERDILETSKEEGRKEGREEGREETENELKPIIEQKDQQIEQNKQTLLNSAEAMLKAGMSALQVKEITKLPEKIIKTLQERLK